MSTSNSKDSRKNSRFPARIFSTLSFTFAVLASVWGGHALAENPSDLPLDVVLVMDSSGSMKRTDPSELRKPAAKLLISLLGEKDRASVVSFSDQGYPVAFLTPVKGQQNEAKLFAAVDKISNKGVYTNLLGAVEGAMRVINRDPLPNRKTIIVLMTDGKMDLGDSVKNQSKSETLLNDLIPHLQNQRIELHTIAFTGESDKAYLEKLATATGGKFNLAQNDKQLHDVYTSIFEQNKQPNMLPFNGEKFSIDNAIKEVTIVGSKDNKEVVLSLITPSGDFMSAENKPDNIKWFTAQAFDLITIQNPQPGQWQIKSSTGKNKAYVITDLKFQLEVEPQEVAIGEGIMISAWLEDKGVTIDKPSILSNLKMVLRVNTPQGDTHELDMQAQAKDDGSGAMTGIYMSHIALPADGRFQIEVIAEGSTFSRVRNSLVKVFDPNSMAQQAAAPVAEAPPADTPPIPNIAPSMDSPIAAQAHTTEAHANAETQGPAEAPPHSSPTEESPHQAMLNEAHDAAGDIHQEAAAPQHDEHPPAEPKGDSKENHAKKADNPAHADKEPAESTSNEGPNLMKALGIFLVINGVFALAGGLAYLIYSMKKKKAATAASDDEDSSRDDRNDEKRAA